LGFRPKDEYQLSKLQDDDLVAYVIAARDAGHDEEVRKTTWMLVDRRKDQVTGLVRSKIRNPDDAEDVLQQVFEGALRARFKGEFTGEFFAMLFKIARNKIADYFEGKAKEQAHFEPVSEDSDPLDGIADGDDFETGVDTGLVYREVLAGFSDRDQMVIRLKIRGYPAKEVAEIVSSSGVEEGEGMTAANCDQVFSRFKKKLRERLSGGGQAQP
jgi:RNA polymerase sigma factor (sigma-70 family)